MKNLLKSLILCLLCISYACEKNIDTPLLGLENNELSVLETMAMIDPSTMPDAQPNILQEGLKSAPTSDWVLVFSDEFNDGSLNGSKWTKNMPTGIGLDGHTHNHQAWLAPENVYEDGNSGKLIISASDERHPNAPYSVQQGGKWFVLDYQSGAIHSKGKFNITQGYIEGRFKSSNNIGTWPAFWMLTENQSWPPEIDILEIPISDANARQVQHYYYHYKDLVTGVHRSFGNNRDHNVNLNDGYHIYGVEWGANYMKYYFDGVLVGSWTNRPEVAQAKDMYILINLAVGGWPGTPPAGQSWPDAYTCDWVRVYSLPSVIEIECENQYNYSPSNDLTEIKNNSIASGGEHWRLLANATDDRIRFDSVYVEVPSNYSVSLTGLTWSTFGAYTCSVFTQGTWHYFSPVIDLYNTNSTSKEVAFGTTYFDQGYHSITFRATGKNANSSGFIGSFDKIKLTPQ